MLKFPSLFFVRGEILGFDMPKYYKNKGASQTRKPDRAKRNHAYKNQPTATPSGYFKTIYTNIKTASKPIYSKNYVFIPIKPFD